MADVAGIMSHEGSDSENEEEWEEMEDEGDTIFIKCLFCEKCFRNAELVWSHCISEHGVNILRIKMIHRLDFYGCIKMINFIRKKAPSPERLKNFNHPLPWESDEFLRPVLPNDGLLQYDFDDGSDYEADKDLNTKIQNEGTIPYSQYLELKQQLHLLEDRAVSAEEQLARAVEDINELKDVAKRMLLGEHQEQSWVFTSSTSDVDGEEDGNAYFSSYAHFGIHEEMLKDKTRTESYRQFICNNSDVFKDKIVLDIGCGTGILSMFAAKAGARHVIGVDQSDIIYQAMDIVRENGLENVVTLVKGLVEEVNLPVDKVDVIISEWMGYFLLFESMLDTVLFARDKWLKPTGCVYPDRCTMSLVALGSGQQRQQKLSFWDDVYGFKMTCMKKAVCREPSIEIVDPKDEISSRCVFKELDVMSCGRTDLQFKSPFGLEILKDDQCSALLAYFDIFFEKKCNQKVAFSTSPSDPPTHWKQTVLFLEQPIMVKKDQMLRGYLSCKKNLKDPRSLDITIEIVNQETEKEFYRQTYFLQ